MTRHNARRASMLAGLVAALACLALPGAAGAALAPVTVVQGATAAGTSTSIAVGVAFNGGDTAHDVAIAMPPGLLIDESLDGGVCPGVSVGGPACQIGTAAINGGAPVPLELVAPPVASGGIAGVQAGPLTGTLTLSSTPAVAETLSFDGVTAATALTQLNLTLGDVRLPTSCPAPSANVSVAADTQAAPATVVTQSAPLTVTGCSSLSYAPTPFAVVTKDDGDTGVILSTGFTQPTSGSATQGFALDIPSTITVNRVLGACLHGTPCAVGTASITSPLLPAGTLSNGAMSVGGSLSAPTLTITFPAPFAFSVVGAISLTGRSIAFSGLPDVPISAMTMTVTGINGARAFVTSCGPTDISAQFTPVDGNAALTGTGAVTYQGCPPPVVVGPPKASASVSGLAGGQPALHLHASRGANAPSLTSVAIGLPAGLSFRRAAFVTRRSCGANHHHCKTTTAVEGLSLAGARLKSAKLQGGQLAITFAQSTAAVTVKLGAPLLSESKSLQRAARKHTVHALTLRAKLTNSQGTKTTVTVRT